MEHFIDLCVDGMPEKDKYSPAWEVLAAKKVLSMTIKQMQREAIRQAVLGLLRNGTITQEQADKASYGSFIDDCIEQLHKI